jgi:hypothetical protein
MSHLAAHAEARPDDAALLEAQLVLLGLADDGGVELTADRGVDEVPHADHAVFLVDEGAHHELAPRRDPGADEGGGGDHGGGEPALHVGGAPPVDAAVHHLGPNGGQVQSGGIAFRHHVGMPFEEEAMPARRLLPDPPDDVRATRRHGLHFDPEALAPKPRLDERGDARLVGIGVTRAMHARDADQGSCQLDDLVGVDLGEERRQRGHWCGRYSSGKDRITASRRITRCSSPVM